MIAMIAVSTAVASQDVPYEDAVRCAGPTQAASEREGHESARGRSLFDSSPYWSLTAGQKAEGVGRA